MLASAASVTVLVAGNDILDPRFDIASRNLEGCNYFIVDPIVRQPALA